MIAEAPAAINFTVFLNMLADKLHGTDPEDVIVNAFKLFDPDGKGVIPKVSSHSQRLHSRGIYFSDNFWRNSEEFLEVIAFYPSFWTKFLGFSSVTLFILETHFVWVRLVSP